MKDNNIEEKNTIIHNNKCYTPKLKKANKIHLELLSFTKGEIKKRENNYNTSFSISKKENFLKKKEDNEGNETQNVEQNSNVIINSNNSDTDDSDIDSSDMSGCEEEVLI